MDLPGLENEKCEFQVPARVGFSGLEINIS
jgi:hypothetical protein